MEDIDKMLGLIGVRAIKVEVRPDENNREAIYVYCVPIKRPPCPRCGSLNSHIDKHSERTVQDLECAGKKVYLIFLITRYSCMEPVPGNPSQICGKTYQAENEMFADKERVTRRFRNMLAEEALTSPFQTVADKYRCKAGNHYHGYTGNVAQSYNEEGAAIIVQADYEQNTYSDSQFMKDYIDGKEDSVEEEIITDGAYQSAENDKAAEEAGITHKATSLTGKKVDPIVTEFEWDEENDTVTKCPNGNEPLRQSTYKNGTTHRIIFDKSQCNKDCPFFERCHAKEQKDTTVVTIDTGSIERAKQQERLQSEAYKQAARERNAVEGVPSVLRRRYNVDRIPVFGKLRSGVFFRFKIMACNVVSLIRHLPKTRGKCAQNEAFA